VRALSHTKRRVFNFSIQKKGEKAEKKYFSIYDSIIQTFEAAECIDDKKQNMGMIS